MTTAEAQAERRARSLEEPLDVRLRGREPFPLVEVHNPIHRTAYLVMLPEFPSDAVRLCTCSDFARRGLGTCKHVEAAARWLRLHPTAPVPPETGARVGPSPRAGAWEEIDRRLVSESPLAGRPRRELAIVGAGLIG